MNATVLIVEDEPAILELIAINLIDAGYTVQRSLDAEGAQAYLRREVPDLMLVDWMLPGMSGLQLIRQVRGDARTKHLPIIMVTARADESDKITGLEAWVDDYVTKPFSPRELKARVRTVLRRRAPETGADPLQVGNLRLDPATHRVTADEQPVSLGPTEFRLLHFLLARPERVHSRSQLLDHVWGEDAVVEERTVDVHIRRLRVALEPYGQDHLIETVRGTGYRLAVPR